MIALITPTGARPKQINLCVEFMRKQDYTGPVLWVIIDDVEPITTEFIKSTFRNNWEIIKIYPVDKWELGMNTQAKNLLIGLSEVKKYKVDSIFIIEDDDYYPSSYIRILSENLRDYDVVGEIRTVYYNPISRSWMVNGNVMHSSLFQTGFKPSMYSHFEQACNMRNIFIDMNFFRLVRSKKINFLNGTPLAIGIKGMLGRSGIGLGHKMEIRMTKDPTLEQLKKFIGDDYKYYENLTI